MTRIFWNKLRKQLNKSKRKIRERVKAEHNLVHFSILPAQEQDCLEKYPKLLWKYKINLRANSQNKEPQVPNKFSRKKSNKEEELSKGSENRCKMIGFWSNKFKIGLKNYSCLKRY